MSPPKASTELGRSTEQPLHPTTTYSLSPLIQWAPLRISAFLATYFLDCGNVAKIHNKSCNLRWPQPTKSNLARLGVPENGSGCFTTAGHFISIPCLQIHSTCITLKVYSHGVLTSDDFGVYVNCIIHQASASASMLASEIKWVLDW